MLGVPEKILKTINIKYSLVFLVHITHPLLQRLPQNHYHCKRINKVKKELDGKPSKLLDSLHVSGYEEAFFPMYLMFLEQKTDHFHVDFKLLHKSNNVIIRKALYLKLLNKDHEHM